MPDDAVSSDAAARSGRYRWVRPAIGGVIAVVLTVEVVLVWDQVSAAWHSLGSADGLWLFGAAVAAAASMHSFAQIQRTLLGSAGVRVTQGQSEAAFYAANSLSTTLPGGPVLSATFLYRQQRRWGATPVVASWQLVMSGVLQAVGLAVLGLGGAFLLGARDNPFSLVFTLGAFITVLVLAQAVASRPELIDGIGVRVLARINAVRGRRSDAGLATWHRLLGQLESVSLGRRDLATAFGWSLFNWVADVACLACAAYAAGGRASVAGLTVAYAAARVAGAIPLVPGGLLVVEAVLVPGLVSSGLSWPDAISAVLIYRLISWLLIAAVGWVVFFFVFRTDTADADDFRPVLSGRRSAGSLPPTPARPPAASADPARAARPVLERPAAARAPAAG
ncbi:YbhN family protein [[Mycobacterium] kokjensenii]|uniref:YbhN family protein n=1 Tax=[Mycobacterium] kokjensenii TaxID=3064287 RepID=A0ABM9L692_9MYCO|nr:YbhN family protein [Mycolicibacter sp. MU0083]CAJ1493069.1 YbhN family protein [Mycolicibacter sp. MU0083]